MTDSITVKISGTNWLCIKSSSGRWIPACKLTDDQVDDIMATQTVLTTNQATALQSTNRPAYYDAEGGSMCNGIGRDYF